MTSQSAAQAISPAIERTKHFLFRPFRLGRFLKLTLVALLVEGGSSGFSGGGNFPSGQSHGSNPPLSAHPWHMPTMHWPSMTMWAVIAAVFVLIVVPLGILIGYLLIRLRFAYFDCVLRQDDQIAPAWGMYHRQAVRYLGLSLCIALGFWIVLIPIGFALWSRFKPLIQSMGSGHAPDMWSFLPLIATLVPLFLLLALAGGLIELTMGSFVLPRMALEDASIAEALSDVWRDFQDEPWQYVFFAVLRFLLSLAASIIAVIALAIPAAVVAVIAVIVVLILKAISPVLAIVLGLAGGILVGGAFVLAAIGLGGTIGTFRRNYALLFYAGRYPLLGSILYPPLPPTAPAGPWQQPGYMPPPNPITGV